MKSQDYAIYFIDLKMPGGIDGIETMMEIRKIHPDASIIIVTAYATVDTAITAMKEGAQEYIVKPCNPEEISLLVDRIIKVKNLQRENVILRKKLTRQYSFHDIMSKSPKMGEIFQLIRDVASLRSTVLIQGESGTGKELIARAIHYSGDRAEKPFVGVSCAALAETLLESELFGHEKGAFTGATAQKKGKFETGRRRDASSSTRSGTSRRSCRWTCSACCRSGRSTGSGERRNHRRCAGDRRDEPGPRGRRSRRDNSATTCTTG